MTVQWQSATFQSFRRRAFCQIIINGKDVTNKFEPFLISVQVVDKWDDIDTCTIELDDRDAKLEIPPDDAPVIVRLGWAGSGPMIPIFRHLQDVYDILATDDMIPKGELPYEASGMRIVFQGWVDSVESGFSRRGGGRRLWIEAKGSPQKHDPKTPSMKSWGEGATSHGGGVSTEGSGGGGGVPLSKVFSEAAKAAGLTAEIDPKFGAISRSFWFQNESFMHMGRRLADEMGGAFKIVGDRAILRPALSDTNTRGEALPTIEAIWSLNLISWRIKPFVGRPQWAGAKSTFFKIYQGLWDNVKSSIGGSVPFGNATATAGSPNAAPNAQVGDQTNEGMGAASQVRRGTGWAIINGEPSAVSGAKLIIIGARPGVDGRYFIQEAEHNYTRGGGYTTRLNVQNPQFIKGYEGWGQLPKGADGNPIRPPLPPDAFNFEE